MLFSKRELRFSRSFLSNMKKSGLNIALACFFGTAIPACFANPTGTIPVIVTSPSPSASPVNSVGTGTTVVIGGGSSNTGSPTPNPSVFETGPFGIVTGNTTTVDKRGSATSGNESTNAGGGNPNYQTVTSGGSTIGAVATTDCSLATSTATFGKTSGSQQIVKSTPCPSPKATSAGNPW